MCSTVLYFSFSRCDKMELDKKFIKIVEWELRETPSRISQSLAQFRKWIKKSFVYFCNVREGYFFLSNHTNKGRTKSILI